MAHAAKKMATSRMGGVTNDRLMRLVKFAAIRRSISGALAGAVPEKVETGHGGTFVRFRLADPRKFHPALFATIPVGQRGTLLVIGTPRSQVKKPAALVAFMKRMGRGLKAEARRSLIYQLRRAGIIGGLRTQAVLVPRSRVLSVAATYARSAAGRVAANPILATIGFNPGKRGKNPLTRWESAQILRQGNADIRDAGKEDALHRGLTAGRVQGRAANVMTYGAGRALGAAVKVYARATAHAYKTRRRRVAKNSGQPGTVAINVPFRDGQKIAPARMRQWLEALPDNAITRLICKRFEMAMKQYKRFHLGSEPTSFTYRAIPMGSQGSRITDVDMVVSEGKEWAAPYQVPKSSQKYDPSVQGRYIHAHGDSKMEVDITKAAKLKKLPERFHTADGKFVGVVPSRNVKITDWYRG